LEIQTNFWRGIRPADYAEIEPEQFIVTLREDQKDTISKDVRTAKKGGDFEQYTIYLLKENKDCPPEDWEKYKIQFLMQSDFEHIARKYGGKSEEWKGKAILVGAVKDKQYHKFILKPAA